jgi:hypothetical protein
MRGVAGRGAAAPFVFARTNFSQRRAYIEQAQIA